MSNPQNPAENPAQNPANPPAGGQQQPYPGPGMPGAMPPSREPYMSVEQQRPKSVNTSFMLWMINVVIGVIGSIITFIVLDDMIEAAANEVGVSVGAAQDAARPIVIGAIVLGLVILGVLALLAFQMRNGKNWARITLTILGALALILALVNIGDEFAVEGFGVVSGLISIARMGLIAVGIVLMYVADSNQFFQSQRSRY
ncbi:MAG: hypothetical protein ACRDQB_01850 [Thermocrispum sp.]